MAEDIELAELIEGAMHAEAREMRVALPGRIQSYDAQKQRAEVELQLSYYAPTTDGLQTAVKHPVLSNVPIAFPQGGGFFMSFPLKKGDPVMVVFCDVPIGAWLSKGVPCEPGVDGMHGLGGAVAFPCGPQPSKTPIQNADADNLAVGSDSSQEARMIFKTPDGEIDAGANANDFVAMASMVKDELQKISALFDSVIGHTHTFVGTGTVGPPQANPLNPPPSPTSTSMYSPSEVGSKNLKAVKKAV